MTVRIGGIVIVIVIAAVASLRLFGGCSSDNSTASADAGGDTLSATVGSGGAGAGGAIGAGGTLGTGGKPGAGGAIDAGGDTGAGGSNSDAAPGTGGAAVADAGAGGNSGAGGTTPATDGSIAGDAAIDGSMDAPTDAQAATLNQIWSTILTVVTPSDTAPGCVGCHEGSDPTIPNYKTTKTAYETLVGQPSTSCNGTRVIAGDAEHSILINKLRAKPNLGLGVVVCGGLAMPYLPDQHITLDQLHMIESWINAGALNN